MLFQLIRWPWTTWGFLQGMWAGRKDVPTVFRVTPKGGTQARPLDTTMMVPPLALGLLPVFTVVLAGDPGSAVGLCALLVVQAVLYLGASLAVTVALALVGLAVLSWHVVTVGAPALSL